MNRDELRQYLPHREPMLLVDEIIINPDGSADAKYLIRDDEFFYPLVLVEGEIVGEGYVQLKPVYRELEKHGFSAEA